MAIPKLNLQLIDFARGSETQLPGRLHRRCPDLATFRRKIDVFGSTSMGFGRANTAGLPAVIFEGLW
jgi:hypothetical protein